MTPETARRESWLQFPARAGTSMSSLSYFLGRGLISGTELERQIHNQCKTPQETRWDQFGCCVRDRPRKRVPLGLPLQINQVNRGRPPYASTRLVEAEA